MSSQGACPVTWFIRVVPLSTQAQIPQVGGCSHGQDRHAGWTWGPERRWATTGALCWWVEAHQSSWGLMGHDSGGLPVWWGGRLRWQGPPAQRGGLFEDLCSGPERSSSRGGGWTDRLGRRWACRGSGSLVTGAPTLGEQESSQTPPPRVSGLLMRDRYPQMWRLRTAHIDDLTVPVGQGSGHSLRGPSAQGLPRLQSRSRPGCIRSGAESCSRLTWLLVAFTSCCCGTEVPFSCWLSAGPLSFFVM